MYATSDDEPPDKDPPVAARSREAEVRSEIAADASLRTDYVVMNLLATIVASYGLLQNSTAVVIGAMIIALLLGPIMGLALAMVDGDMSLFKKALAAELVGATAVVFISLVVGRIHAGIEIGPEILSRTKPNLLDLAIALAGGAAGAYATVSPRVRAGMVGVAISTALVPPLASAGICISRGYWSLAGGAVLLFLANLVAIQCASSCVLFLFGYHKVTDRTSAKSGFVRRLVLDGAIFLGLAVFLYLQLASTVAQQRYERTVREKLERGLTKLPGATLAQTRFLKSGVTRIVIALVRTPNSITPKQTAELESLLRQGEGQPIVLHIRSTLTKETTSGGYLHELAPNSPPIDSLPPATEPESEIGEPVGSISDTEQVP